MKNIFVYNYVVLDTETTGLSYRQGEKIIQISAIKYINDQEKAIFDQYIDPEGVWNSAEDINHISDEQLEGQPTIDEVKDKLLDFVDEMPVIGHNLSFDLGFLDYEGVDVDKIRENKIDTLSLARKALHSMKGNTLVNLEDKFNIKNDQQHNSLFDVRATAEIYKKLRDDYKKEILESINRHGKRIYKKHKVAKTENNLLNGTRIVITGQISNYTRDEARHYIEELGGKSPSSVSKLTDYLIVGKQVSKVKDKIHNRSGKEIKALKYGTNIINWDEFQNMINEMKQNH